MIRGILLGLLFSVFSAGAQISVNLTNDMLGGTDRYYSHGTQITYSTKDRDYFLLQNIYTPEDIQTTELQTEDRRYSGLLAVGLDFKRGQDLEIRDRAMVGVLGPSASAEFSQNTVHEWRGISTAKGWAHQLEDRPILNVSRQLSIVSLDSTLQVGQHVKFDAGNFLTGAKYGIPVRWGYNAPRFQENRIRVEGVNDLSFGLEWTPAIQYVAYDATLHGVNKEEFYGEYSFGFFLNYGRFGIGLYRVEKTNKFEGQGGGERFGAISFKF